VLFEALARELKAVPGIPELLERLEQLELSCCVASNSTPERLRLSLQRTGLLRHFEGRMFSGASVAHPKPAPDLFLHAAASMGATPSACAVIEDTPTGVTAGIAAGMAVFAYVGGIAAQRDKLAAAGGHPFNAMSGLETLLRTPRYG
jgi:HAD superfamily hydrolase (TIGR01509 family)